MGYEITSTNAHNVYLQLLSTVGYSLDLVFAHFVIRSVLG
jgi:hypothetical protein